MKFSRSHTYDPPIRITDYAPLKRRTKNDDSGEGPPAGGLTAFKTSLPNPPNGDELDEAFFYRLLDGRIVGYFNRCTHVNIPMDYDDGNFLDREGFILCSVHGARFDLETGDPVFGPGRGPLTRIRCEEDEETLVVLGWEKHF